MHGDPACNFQKAKGSAIDKRTTRHPVGYTRCSLKIRKRIEEVFGWSKTVPGLRQNPVSRSEKSECCANRIHLRSV